LTGKKNAVYWVHCKWSMLCFLFYRYP